MALEKSFTKILNQAPLGIILFSEDWSINYINDNFYKLTKNYKLNFTSLENINLINQEIFSDVSLKEELLELKAGYPFEKEIKRVATLLGKEIILHIKGSPLYENDTFAGGILIIQDIESTFHSSKEDFSESLYEILGRNNEYLFITDASGRVLYTFGEHITNLSIVPNKIEELFTAPHIKKVFEEVFKAKQTRYPAEFDAEIRLKEKNLKIECRLEPLLNKKRQVQMLFFFLKDISSLNSLKQLESVFYNLSEPAFLLDMDFNIELYNNSAKDLLLSVKNAPAALKSLFVKDLDLYEIKNNLLNNKEVKEKNVSNGPQPIQYELSFKLLEDYNRIFLLIKDITHSEIFEQNLKDAVKKYKNVIDQADEAICTLDVNGTILFANPEFFSITGYSEDEIIGKKIIDVVDSEFKKFFAGTLLPILNIELEIPIKTKPEEIKIFKGCFKGVYNDNHDLLFVNGFFHDATHSKEIEKENVIFRSLFNGSQDGILAASDNKIFLVNGALARLFGYKDPEEMQEIELLELIEEKEKGKYFLDRIRSKEIPERFEFIARKKDSSNFYAAASASTFQLFDRKCIMLVIRDITERKRSQHALKESEDRYRSITENIDDFLYMYERVNNLLRPMFYTSSVEKITGYSQYDFLSDSKLAVKIIHPDDFIYFKRKLKNMMKSKIQLSEEIEFRIFNKHGNIVWIRNKINLVRGKDGAVIKLYGLVSDITLRKKAEEELKKSTENLIKLNETKDKFISIISHDLRTPFSSILGFSDLLLSDDDLDDSEKKQYVKFIQDASKSMLSLVNSLLDWTRLQTGRIKFEPEKCDTSEIIKGTIHTLSGMAIKKNIDISSLIPDNHSIFVDRNLIVQVLNNLISNAIKFTGTGGKISVIATPSDKFRFTQFEIQDTGIGIQEENLPYLFRIDTKFTTEGTAGERGSGLGLSLVKEIIEKHGGQIWVESKYGYGSTFKFTLPATPANILLVDDSRTDRILYSKILKNITPDYTIETAATGKEAINKILASPPALVITDHIMPEVNGYEMILMLKKSDLKTIPPIIVLSSDIDRNAIADYNNLGVEYVFQKPVNLMNFKLAVEKSLRKGMLD